MVRREMVTSPISLISSYDSKQLDNTDPFYLPTMWVSVYLLCVCKITFRKMNSTHKGVVFHHRWWIYDPHTFFFLRFKNAHETFQFPANLYQLYKYFSSVFPYIIVTYGKQLYLFKGTPHTSYCFVCGCLPRSERGCNTCAVSA